MQAPAKVNLALVVGPLRPDGKHEVVTVMQRVGLHDVVEVEAGATAGIEVDGFPDDTLVRRALSELAAAASTTARWRVSIDKRIPVAAGLGGGSSDAAAALAGANAALAEPLTDDRLRSLAAGIGVDVPFFLAHGAQLGTGDGSTLAPLELPGGYVVVLALPGDARKESTAAVYRSFDERGAADGFEARRAALLAALETLESAENLAGLPRNDLASSPLAQELEQLGALRADVTGAGPTVYALFEERDAAERAAIALGPRVRTWVVDPVP